MSELGFFILCNSFGVFHMFLSNGVVIKSQQTQALMQLGADHLLRLLQLHLRLNLFFEINFTSNCNRKRLYLIGD